MPSATSSGPNFEAEFNSFSEHLQNSHRILILCGAGLSASSGLPTFRGAGGLWRNNDATTLATPEAFSANPSLVWQFYAYRRHMALRSQPNPAHHALASLSKLRPKSLTISQNVDGLSPRAGHRKENLELLHGSLSDLKCSGFDCDYTESDNFQDPLVPALAVDDTLDLSDARVPLKDVPMSDLPHCPQCRTSLLRPGVVWFGEQLPSSTLDRVESWMSDGAGIDLLIVIGTSAKVYPAAGYIAEAREAGARVAVVNTETPDTAAGMLRGGDWFFRGDAGVVVPRILGGLVGGSIGGEVGEVDVAGGT